MGGIVIVLTFVLAAIVPLVLTAGNIYYLFRKGKWKGNYEALTLTLGPLLTAVLLGLWDMKDWTEPLEFGGGMTLRYHAFISSQYLPVLIILAGLAMLGYMLLRSYSLKMPPLLIVISIAFVYLGDIVAVLWILQLLPYVTDAGVLFGFEGVLMCLFPANFLILSFSQIRGVVRTYNNTEEAGDSRLAKLLRQSEKWPLAGLVAMIPIMGIIVLLLILFGQKPDAAIRAFTETSDWLFSTKVSPAPISIDGHYLCTAAARGDRKIVKPLRMGVRHGNRVVVNRQLCIANAFEEFINEHLPRFHHGLRYVYDKYGYPLARHITTRRAANITYILMKPLEWLFLLVLYLFDRKPENRIAAQYLPIKKKEC